MPILILVKFFVPRAWIMDSTPLCPAEPLLLDTLTVPKGRSMSSCITTKLGLAFAKAAFAKPSLAIRDFTALPELFMKVWGFASRTGCVTPGCVKPGFTQSARRELDFLSKLHSSHCHCLANTSTTKNPTLCLVFSYCSPGFPSPMIRYIYYNYT